MKEIFDNWRAYKEENTKYYHYNKNLLMEVDATRTTFSGAAEGLDDYTRILLEAMESGNRYYNTGAETLDTIIFGPNQGQFFIWDRIGSGGSRIREIMVENIEDGWASLDELAGTVDFSDLDDDSRKLLNELLEFDEKAKKTFDDIVQRTLRERALPDDSFFRNIGRGLKSMWNSVFAPWRNKPGAYHDPQKMFGILPCPPFCSSPADFRAEKLVKGMGSAGAAAARRIRHLPSEVTADLTGRRGNVTISGDTPGAREIDVKPSFEGDQETFDNIRKNLSEGIENVTDDVTGRSRVTTKKMEQLLAKADIRAADADTFMQKLGKFLGGDFAQITDLIPGADSRIASQIAEEGARINMITDILDDLDRAVVTGGDISKGAKFLEKLGKMGKWLSKFTPYGIAIGVGAGMVFYDEIKPFLGHEAAMAIAFMDYHDVTMTIGFLLLPLLESTAKRVAQKADCEPGQAVSRLTRCKAREEGTNKCLEYEEAPLDPKTGKPVPFEMECELTPMEKIVRDNMNAHFKNWCETWGECEEERTQNELYDIVMKQQQDFNDTANSLRARSMKPHQLMRGKPKAGKQPDEPPGLRTRGDMLQENFKRTKKLKIIIENNKKLVKRKPIKKLKVYIN